MPRSHEELLRAAALCPTLKQRAEPRTHPSWPAWPHWIAKHYEHLRGPSQPAGGKRWLWPYPLVLQASALGAPTPASPKVMWLLPASRYRITPVVSASGTPCSYYSAPAHWHCYSIMPFIERGWPKQIWPGLEWSAETPGMYFRPLDVTKPLPSLSSRSGSWQRCSLIPWGQSERDLTGCTGARGRLIFAQ